MLMCECWSQWETAVSAGSPQSPLFHPSPRAQTQACCDTSAAGEERVCNSQARYRNKPCVREDPGRCSGGSFAPSPPRAERVSVLGREVGVCFSFCQQAGSLESCSAWA